MALYVQYGCGMSCPESWVNFDASPTLRMQRTPLLGRIAPGPRFPHRVRFGDIVSGLPLADASCDGIYCSHVLEHLSLADCRAALRNTFRVLKPGRTFRLCLPDIEQIVRDYVGSADAGAATNFIDRTGMGFDSRPRGLRGAVREWMGNARHKWMWDYKSLAAELSGTGFTDVRRAQFGDGDDPAFAAVEDAGRWGDGCLGIQCKRPG